jgi:hypothetical protein
MHIDRVFEALYAFYRINDRTKGESQDIRLFSQLSKRAIRPTIEASSTRSLGGSDGNRSLWTAFITTRLN